MMKNAKLFETDSYFNLFNILKEQIKSLKNGIDDRTIIFCEEKMSLLIESSLCDEKNGSFSTKVFSFGNYLRMYSPLSSVLTREGSVMAIRRLLKTLPLKCFSRSKKNIASSINNVIVQLKSAKVLPDDIRIACEQTDGVLKNKLEDIFVIYSAYEKFLQDNNYQDQSSVLTRLPEMFAQNENIKNTNIILVGYTSLTKQAVSAIESLIENAKSMTAILTAGENTFAFVNEVSSIFKLTCARLNVDVETIYINSNYPKNAKNICDSLFNPLSFDKAKTDCDNIYKITATNGLDEIEKVGEIIKASVLKGARYKDFAIAIPTLDSAQYNIKKVFSTLDIPYFIDTKSKGDSTALVSLILSYIEVFRKNMERESVLEFVKNPLFIDNKEDSDAFENYVIRYNINYSLFKSPFTLAVRNEDLVKLNEIREKMCLVFSSFNIRKMLNMLNIEEKQQVLTTKLKELGFSINGAINEQIYSAVITILDEMDMLLGENVDINDIKETFVSGINALEISLLPQYKDAVYIGNYKETALIQNKYVFALDLTSDVPTIKDDVSILCDSDIDRLENIKIRIDPKIKIINHRSRENIAMALSSFSKALFLCCPNSTENGKKLLRSEVFFYFEKLFDIKESRFSDRYLTQKQGLYSFGKDCTMFADGRISEIEDASNYYYAVKPNVAVSQILQEANREIVPVVLSNRSLIPSTTSPTSLEEYSKCPYRAFMRLYLRIAERDRGEVDPLSIGNIVHEVFEKYVGRINEVLDKESSDSVASSIFEEIINREEYKKYLLDDKENQTIIRTREEVLEFCFRIYLQLKCSKFKPTFIEKKFGDGKEGSLPPIKLLSGKVNLKGKIDRVDCYNDYIRVVDYKTGKCDSKKDKLFYGSKLQLYLYSQVFSDKKVAGSYYMPISNSFQNELDRKNDVMLDGDSLGEKEVLAFQDENYLTNDKSSILPSKIKGDKIEKASSEEELSAFSKYAYLISNKIAENMSEGFIPASPLEGECEYCSFRDICDDCYLGERKLSKVDSDTIKLSVNKEEK